MSSRCRVLGIVLALALMPLLTPAASAAPAVAKKVCQDNGQCDRSQFCQKRSGKCSGAGQCATRPQVCIDLFDPVCGCNKVTYSNSCFANMAGVNILHAGACETDCSTNADCAKTDYCAKATGDCKGRGRCTKRPEICTEIFDPVCGCDGKVYPNACQAASAGVSVSSLGDECKKAM